jgi:hypothetical protein
MGVTVFGIRHHGPGCARSLRRALDESRPDVIVIEGPPDAEDLLPWVAHGGLVPPLALLVWQVGEPRRAAYFPLAVFSPEWQALIWAAENNVPARFMDLPQSHQLALDIAQEKETDQSEDGGEASVDGTPDADPGSALPTWRTDPLALMAEAAGYTDHELWWEDQIERRADATGLFVAIHEAMCGIRAEFPAVRARDLEREAYIR